ncbi:YeeE/YedE family protein [Sinorhizobium fredii USDA 205]|uniref:YeeE/YedE family protein n=2 Tax=Rhizobium fredii TaxID=380 RepID=A0A2A6M3S8_RHIFR|nr:YeeE/YedE thiosulfate transporter family protein [Sinorhizobium fredii]ASY69174.1 putative transmembrane protein [Sinorhizobium fredii CCBAU 83666]AWM25308.1 putative transmembrane protein [Sinorhizobium fredii CCBAU 25509]KSV89801.1 YeeE/YedE family protein [Sinorhizobium fredii USDA 205]MCG5474605.1 YeeE/YedE family protein [Sinorhizobium fredii]MQW95223.1 YeeE/YedE family protein [Sinorhizobium fredii]
MTAYLATFCGGMLIGLSAVILMMANGRVAGVSGIAGRLLQGVQTATGAAFVIGLFVGPVLFRLLAGAWPVVELVTPWPLVVAGGLLVGYGSRMGSGCTSGHGVVGLARLSRRSMAAVASFMAAAVATVYLMGLFA